MPSGDHRSRLPARRTGLIGRTTDLESVRDRLLDGHRRAITLTGAAGIGKSTLALEIARELEPRLPDGACLVDLAVVPDNAAVPQAISDALGLVDQDRPVLESVADHLATHETLLVLEHCEHLLPALASTVDTLLDGASGLRILATSRTPLRVRDETIHAITPLAVPPPDVLDIERVSRSDSVQLFVERATAANDGFSLTATSAPAVASICRRLDGIPLAIELVAAWSSVLSAVEIDERLAAEGTLGTADEASGDDRTMQGTLDWGHELLSADAQALYRRLAVFSGGWTIESAGAVGSLGDASASVVPVLADLVRHSLVVREGDEARSRYRMLAPIAEHAGRRLDAAGERGPAGMAHATFFLGLSTTPHPELGQCDPEDIERVAVEHENCLAAIRFAAATGVVPVRLGLVLNLIQYWRVRGHLHLAVEQLEAALAMTADGSMERGVVHGVLAEFRTLLGDYAAADLEARAGEAVFRALGAEQGIATTIAQQGLAAAGRGEFDAALATLHGVFPQVVESGDETTLAYWQAAVGRLELERGQPAAAEPHLAEADRLFRARPSWYHGRVLAMLGVVAQRHGDHAQASSLYLEGLRSLCEYGAIVDAIACLEDMARLEAETGEWRRAATLLGAATGRRDASAAVASVPDRARLVTDIDAIHSHLAIPDFEAAWATGMGMTLEDTIAFLESPRPAPPGSQTASSGPTLTPREREIAGLVALGLSNREIADRLVIAPGTVKIHVERILGKLGRTSRVQIATWAQRADGGLPPARA